MIKMRLLCLVLLTTLTIQCSDVKNDKSITDKVSRLTGQEREKDIVGFDLRNDTLPLRPGAVLLTGHPAHRLVPIYKVNFPGNRRRSYIGQNRFHVQHWEAIDQPYMPGLSAMYGHNLLNISLFDATNGQQQLLLARPGLINTVYYPSYRADSLEGRPILRDYYLLSVYDTDTNQDSMIDRQDLRKLYHFDLATLTPTLLIDAMYSVHSSQYDPGTDAMFIYARLDENGNGSRESNEPMHIFRIDLRAPKPAIRMYD